MKILLEKYIPKFLSCMYDHEIKGLATGCDLIAMFHHNQIESKYEVLNACRTINIDKEKINCLYIGSWMGFLTSVLIKEYGYTVSELDLDPICSKISYYINNKLDNWSNNYGIQIVGDACHQNFSFYSQFDLIINLSSEHMSEEWYHMIPNGTHLIIQNNDYDSHEDHINCVGNIDLLKDKFPLSQITYQSTLNCDVYNRFTLAGIK